MALSSQFYAIAALGVVVYICVSAVVNYRKLSAFKGPRLAGFSRLWLLRQSTLERVHIAQKEALEEYGMHHECFLRC